MRSSSDKPLLKIEQLTVHKLNEMHKNGMSIANHSHTHSIFDKCPEQELILECENSKDTLKKLGFNSKVFAYPNGNYSKMSEKILRRFNVNLIYLFDDKINYGKINPMRISRLLVNDYTSLRKFKFILSGNHSKIFPVIKLLFRFMKK